jgi:hypothetical protein
VAARLIRFPTSFRLLRGLNCAQILASPLMSRILEAVEDRAQGLLDAHSNRPYREHISIALACSWSAAAHFLQSYLYELLAFSAARSRFLSNREVAAGVGWDSGRLCLLTIVVRRCWEHCCGWSFASFGLEVSRAACCKIQFVKQFPKTRSKVI